MIHLISHVTEEKSANFSLNIVLDVFRDLDPTYLPYGIVCMDRRITYTYGSTARSKFIYTETEDATFLPFVETFLTICQNILDLNKIVLHFAMSEVILPLPRTPSVLLCLYITNPPLCLYVSELHVTCCSDCKYMM